MIAISSPACRKAAALLEAASPGAPSPGLMSLCARCLYEAAEFGPGYVHSIRVCLPFLDEMKEKLDRLCEGERCAPELLHDLAFELIECFAVIAKENALHKGTQPALPAQAEVMRFFEECGEWAPEDGTMVSHYYHTLLSDGTRAA